MELGPRVVRQERILSVGREGERWSSRGSPATSGSTIQPSGRVPTGWAAQPAVCHSGSPGGEQPPVDAPPLSRRVSGVPGCGLDMRPLTPSREHRGTGGERGERGVMEGRGGGGEFGHLPRMVGTRPHCKRECVRLRRDGAVGGSRGGLPPGPQPGAGRQPAGWKLEARPRQQWRRC